MPRSSRSYKYHVTDEWIATEMAKGCAICGTKERLHIDHDHACCNREGSCGKCVRGVLCDSHNHKLRYWKDDAEALTNRANHLEGIVVEMRAEADYLRQNMSTVR